MNKYIIKKGLLVFVTFLFFSCNDAFIERYPLDGISNETFWNTENDLMVYNNSLYNLARDDHNVPIMMGHDELFRSTYYGVWWLDQFSDNISASSNTSSTGAQYYRNVRAGINAVPSNAGAQYFGYGGWNFVRAINVGLDNYDKAEIAQSVIDKYAAEARLFRGWFYADKVSKFGDVTWVEHELNTDSEELYAERTPREQVMTKVLADLNFACEKLPDDWGDGNAPGRLNRWCALQVKSRVCLFEGTWRKYHGGADATMWLQQAADAAKELIETGPYSLYVTGDPQHDYNAFHRVDDLTGNPEVLYWRRYEVGFVTNSVMRYFTVVNGGTTKSMVEDYLCTDGLPITLSQLYEGDEVYENIFANRDPRLRQTVLHPGDHAYYDYEGSLAYAYPRLLGLTGGATSETGYHVIKTYNVELKVVALNNGWSPAITLRLAEALLNYAEAKAELGTITQTDLDMSINKLRDRVAMPHLELNNVPIDPSSLSDFAIYRIFIILRI
jgi:hypothetical protein